MGPGLEDLLGELYAAAVDPDRWERFLELLMERLGGPCAVFLDLPGTPRGGVSYDVGFRSEPGYSYNAEMRPQNPFVEALRDAPVGKVIHADAVLRREALETTAFFDNVFLAEGLAEHTPMIVVLARDEDGPTAGLAAFTSTPQPSAEAAKLLEQLTPHLRRARDVHVDRARANAATRALLAALDRLLLGVLLLDEDGRVIFSNRSGAELVASQGNLHIDKGQLSVADEDHDEALQELIARATRTGESWGDPAGEGALAIGEGRRRVDLLVTALRRRQADRALGAEAAAAVFIGGAQQFSEGPAHVLEHLYSLTPSEARLARLLAMDRSVEQASEELGIKTTSARTVLKRIFAKTNTSRQASLVRLLVAGPAQLRRDD